MREFTMRDYTRLSHAERCAVRAWADDYIDSTWCFRFEIAQDGPRLAVRFHVYDDTKCLPGTSELPSHTVDAFNVAPCPVPI